MGKHPSQATMHPFRQRSVNPTVNIEIDARVNRVVQSKVKNLVNWCEVCFIGLSNQARVTCISLGRESYM